MAGVMQLKIMMVMMSMVAMLIMTLEVQVS